MGKKAQDESLVPPMYIMNMLRMRCHKGEQERKQKRVISFKYILRVS